MHILDFHMYFQIYELMQRFPSENTYPVYKRCWCTGSGAVVETNDVRYQGDGLKLGSNTFYVSFLCILTNMFWKL